MSTVPAKIVPLPQRRLGLPWLLGLGAFGLAFSLTTTSAYLPPLLGRFTDSRTLIAVVLGSEGVFALTLPLVIGPWSDTFQTPLGRRRPFMFVAFMPSLWLMTLILLAFFFAYYVYEPPYRGLYPDLLPQSEYGRAQGVQHLLRGLAIGTGLIGGGLLFDVWHAAPRSSSFASLPVRRTACSRASAPTSLTAGASCATSPRCGASSSATRLGRGRSRARASSSSSTSRKGSGSPSRRARPCSRRSRAATSSPRCGPAGSATASGSRA